EAFLDAAGGWDDPEPPAQPPAAPAPAPAPPVDPNAGARTPWAPSSSAHSDTFYDAQSGWDDQAAGAPCATTLAAASVPTPAPATSNGWAQEAAAQQDAFLDAAEGWGDPNPPVRAPPVKHQDAGYPARPHAQAAGPSAGWGGGSQQAARGQPLVLGQTPIPPQGGQANGWGSASDANRAPDRQGWPGPPGAQTCPNGQPGAGEAPMGMSKRAIADWQATVPAGVAPCLATPLAHQHAPPQTPNDADDEDDGGWAGDGQQRAENEEQEGDVDLEDGDEDDVGEDDEDDAQEVEALVL
ncbi:hypothetical protein OC835_007999, partial [Tilletia horrida]